MRFGPVAVAAVGLLVLLVGGLVFYSWWNTCLGGGRAAVMDVPHYEDPQRGPRSTEGGCEVSYTTEASRKKVLAYYNENLRKEGWKPTKSPYRAYPPFKKGTEGKFDRLSEALKESPKSATAGLSVRRGGYTYSVDYWPPNKRNPEVPNDKALVIASVAERQ